jgi:hypothetical protein
VTFGVGVFYKKFSSKPEFLENRRSDSHTLVNAVNNFITVIPYFMTGLGELLCRILHVMQFNMYEFSENGHNEAVLYLRT